MPAEGCARCHSSNTPRKAVKPRSSVMVCQNRVNCRRRQKALYRQRRRTMAQTRGL